MDCLRFHQLVQRHLDGDLGPVHARLMNEHVTRCDECAVTLADYALLFDTLAHLQRDIAPADLEAAVLARIDVRAFCPAPRERGLQLLMHPENVLPRPVQMGVAAALLLGLLYGGTGWLGMLAARLLHGLGVAATWTYGWVTGALADNAAQFAYEEWPAIRSTTSALANAMRLLLGAHADFLGLVLLGVAALVACAVALRRVRSRHAHLHLA